jgi:hypothetical protein
MAAVTSRGEVDLLSIALTSDNDLSAAANKNKLLKQTATGVVLCTALGDRVIGVLTNKPLAGKPAQIAVIGVAKCQAGAVVAAGDFVKTDATARAITCAGEAAGTLVEAFGIALEAAGAAGDMISVLLTRAVINRAVS